MLHRYIVQQYGMRGHIESEKGELLLLHWTYVQLTIQTVDDDNEGARD